MGRVEGKTPRRVGNEAASVSTDTAVRVAEGDGVDRSGERTPWRLSSGDGISGAFHAIVLRFGGSDTVRPRFYTKRPAKGDGGAGWRQADDWEREKGIWKQGLKT